MQRNEAQVSSEPSQPAAAGKRKQREACIRQTEINTYVERLLAFQPTDGTVEQHLVNCETCRKIAQTRAFSLGLVRSGEVDPMRAVWRAADGSAASGGKRSVPPTDDTPPLSYLAPLRSTNTPHYLWFTAKDRPGIVREVTDLVRLYDLNLTYMAAVANLERNESVVGFELAGPVGQLMQFNRDWPDHLSEIKTTRVKSRSGKQVFSSESEFALWMRGVDQPGIVARFVDLISRRFRAQMRCFVAETASRTTACVEDEFTLECRILPRDAGHRDYVLHEVQCWAEEHGILVRLPDLQSVMLPQVLVISKGNFDKWRSGSAGQTSPSGEP